MEDAAWGAGAGAAIAGTGSAHSRSDASGADSRCDAARERRRRFGRVSLPSDCFRGFSCATLSCARSFSICRAQRRVVRAQGWSGAGSARGVTHGRPLALRPQQRLLGVLLELRRMVLAELLQLERLHARRVRACGRESVTSRPRHTRHTRPLCARARSVELWIVV